MNARTMELVAVLTTVAGVAGATLFPFAYEAGAASPPATVARAITLTGVAATGTWTDQPVTVQVSAPSVVKYWLEPPPPPGARLPERGRWLFRSQGCFLCHGPEGQGGVANRNYVKETIPPLNRLAERLMLFDPEDVSVIVEHMSRGQRLEALADSAPVPRYHVFLAQYHSVQNIIRKGSLAGKKDPKGPVPPLNMPAWGEHLSEADIDAILAYLLTLRPAESQAR